MDKIIEIVSNYCNIEPSIVFSSSRKEEVVQARFLCYYFLKKHLGLTQRVIADKFKKDASAIHYGIKEIRSQMEVYVDLREDAKKISLLINHWGNNREIAEKEDIYKDIVLKLIRTDMKSFSQLDIKIESKNRLLEDLSSFGKITKEEELCAKKKLQKDAKRKTANALKKQEKLS